MVNGKDPGVWLNQVAKEKIFFLRNSKLNQIFFKVVNSFFCQIWMNAPTIRRTIATPKRTATTKMAHLNANARMVMLVTGRIHVVRQHVKHLYERESLTP